jgi:hypothetical protein
VSDLELAMLALRAVRIAMERLSDQAKAARAKTGAPPPIRTVADFHRAHHTIQ